MALTSSVVWRIGDPERDQEQFDESWFVTRLDDPPTFRIGESDPGRDWPRFQPGPLHANTSFRSTSVSVAFELDEVHDGRLRLDVYAGHGPTPALDVAINGRCGRYHLRPQRTDRAGLNGPPTLVAGWAHIDIVVPAEHLRNGDNLVAITTVSAGDVDPSELVPAQMAHFNWFGSGIAWGGLSFHRHDAAASTQPTALLAPTPLHVDADDGLQQLVDVTVCGVGEFAEAHAELEVGGRTIIAALPPEGRTFGEWHARLAIPALDAPSEVRLRVIVDGSTVVHETVEMRPGRRWTLHVIPHVHLDLGYTDHAAKVMELHSRNLDRAVGILANTPDWAFTVDGTVIVDDYLRTRRTSSVDGVVAALRSGRLGLNAYSMLFLTGLASLEECYRAAYAARRLGDEFGIPVDVAHLTDVPSYSSALPSLLADLGIDRFVGIQNHGRAATVDSDELHLASPVRWAGPDGAEVVTFFADAYAQLRFLFGDPVTVAGGAAILPRLLGRFERPDYLPTHFPIVGSHSDNEDVAGGYADLVERWNRTYAWPRMTFSTFTDYFDAIEEHRDQLSRITGDGGSYWEDGVGAHAASMATYRTAQDALPVVETLSALTAQRSASVRVDREGMDTAWDTLLLGCEHTWSSAHSVSHHHSATTAEMTDWKVHQIDHAAHLVRDAGRRAMSQLGELVTTVGRSAIAFNGLAWQREVELEVELASGEVLLDEGGDAAACDVVGRREDLDVVRVRAAVPAFGYRVWPVGVAADTRTGATPEQVPEGSEVVVGQWHVTVEGGVITGLRHGDRELLDQGSAWGLGDVLHVRAGGTAAGRGLGSERTSLSEFGPRLPLPDLDVARVALGAASVRRTPWGAVLRLEGAGRTLPAVAVELHLRSGDDRVDVVVDLDKEAELAKESVYVAFPFAVDDPSVRYDRQVAWVDPTVDHQVGACNEWFTTLHGVRVGDIAWCAADAPLFTLGQPVQGRWPTAAVPSATILSWPMNNHWWTNYPASQAGRVLLRYAFRPGVTTDGDAARFGREVRGGALTSTMVFQDKVAQGRPDRDARPLPAGQGQLLVAGDAWAGLDVRLMAAQDGAGVIVRVADLDGRERILPLDGLGGLRITHRCDALERDLEDVARRPDVTLGAWEVLTLRAVAS